MVIAEQCEIYWQRTNQTSELHGCKDQHCRPRNPVSKQGRFFVAIVRSLGGRMEKRLPIAVVVCLTQREVQSPSAAELTYTNNVSAHGACVISCRPWKLGEMVDVTALEEEVPLHGKVVHCRKHTDNHYAVGLSFNGDQVTWSRYGRYART